MARKFDLVLFDLGDTLMYFDGVYLEILEQANQHLFQALVEAGYRLDPGEFIPAFRTHLQAYYRQRDVDFIEHTVESVLRATLTEAGYPNIPPEHVRAALGRMYAFTHSFWRREEDALPTLVELKRLGYRLGLISNAADANDVRDMIRQHELEPWLEQVLISAEVKQRKPHPAIYQQALYFFGVPAERAVMVGDKLNVDVVGAQNAGLTGIWIARRAHRTHENTIQADATIETLAELPSLLENWK